MKRFTTALFVVATLAAAPVAASPAHAAPVVTVAAEDPPYGCYYIFDFLYCVDIPIE